LKKILSLFCLLATISCTFSKNNEPTPQQEEILDDFATKVLSNKDQSTGFATAIAMGSKCDSNDAVYEYAGTNGIKDLTPIKETSLFQIGSITKSFISVVVLQLAQEFNFSIDDNHILSKYFPEYPNWGNITLRQLMNMTSGIPGYSNNNFDDDIYIKYTAEQYKNYINPITILNQIHQLPMHFTPGSKYEYSNTNYTVLGQFIKKITKSDPEDEVNNRIIHKLNLNHTYFPKDKLAQISGINEPDIVRGYLYDPHPYPYMKFGEEVTQNSLSYCNTACAINSTPQDVNTYVHALFSPGILLNESQIKELTSLVSEKSGLPLILNSGSEKIGYGLGIIGLWSKENRLVYFYQGSTDGYSFIFIFDPTTNLYLSFGVNIQGSSSTKIINYDSVFDLLSKLNQVCQNTKH